MKIVRFWPSQLAPRADGGFYPIIGAAITADRPISVDWRAASPPLVSIKTSGAGATRLRPSALTR